MLALEARGLVKKFKDVIAVAGVDLQVARGECLALLGPNGAGKTTTVEMLEGLLTPDAGTVTVCGLALPRDRRAIMERIGVLLQETSLYKRYTVRETLQLFASFYKTAADPAVILERLALTDKADVQLRKLSGGQKQRAYLGCSLINDPELLFLDEPTTGLDPQARRAIWELLAGIKAEGRSILLTTHYMEEAERLADRVAIIDHGKIIALGTPRELIARHLTTGQLLSLRVKPASPGGDLLAVRWPEGARPSPTEAGLIEGHVRDVATEIPSYFAAAASGGCEVLGLELRSGTLEDVFLTLTGRSMRNE